MSIYNNDIKGIVLFGGMGSGKDTVAELIHQSFDCRGQYVMAYNIGNLCRQFEKIATVEDKWKDNERKLIQSVASKLREIDVNILNQYVLARIKEDGDGFSIVVGGRTKDDFDYWTAHGFLSIGIEVDDAVAVERVKERDGVVSVADKSHSTEVDVKYIVNELCDVKIDNNGTIENLMGNVDKVIRKVW